MKIRMTITLDIDAEEWSEAYGVPENEVRTDVKGYVKDALWALPVAPSSVIVK